MVMLQVMQPADVMAVHAATLRILGQVGVILGHAEGRRLLGEAGARLDGERVLIPPELVEVCVGLCPQQVRLRGRSGMVKCLGDGRLHWHNLGGARLVYEPHSGKCRPALVQDVRDATRLLDALDSATTITPFYTPQDVPGAIMSLAMYRHALPHTLKPLQGPGMQNGIEVGYAIRMAEVVGEPEEVLSLSVSPVSPLSFNEHAVEAILAIARAGVAFGPLPCPTAGTTAPLSLCGAIAQQNAEVLACIVLAQVAHPGLPVIYCGRLAMMEPRTGLSVWGGVELGLASAGTVQMAHHYGLPVNVYGFSTNSPSLDIQNGFERALNAAIPALAGADELSGIGEMQAGVAGSSAQMVCDNEIAMSVQRLRRGFVVNDEALGVEVVANAMAGARNFLTQKHTLKYLRGGEVLLTQLAERGTWESWERAGRQGMAERAQAEAEHLLATHRVEGLDEAQERELDALLGAAQAELEALEG